MKFNVFKATLLIVLGLLAAFVLWPSPIHPVSWQPPKAPAYKNNLATNHRLAMAERLGLHQLHAAEDIAVDAQGNVYATDENRIVRLSPDGKQLSTIATTQGQNLGLEWINPHVLAVANQPLGVLTVDTNTGKVTPIPNSTVHYANAMAVSQDGSTLYVSDSSDKYYGESWKYLYDLLEARPHGRLFAVDLKTGQFWQLADQLYYPNGVALSPQEDYVLVNETYRYRIRRIWLKGPHTGSSDIFADNLPGFPDGLSRDPQTGNYWAALYTIRNLAIDKLHPHPWIKAQLAKLPRELWPKPKHYGMVIVLNPQGNIVDTLQDPNGTIFAVSSARRIGNQLYLGSLHGGFAGRLNLHTTELSAK